MRLFPLSILGLLTLATLSMSAVAQDQIDAGVDAGLDMLPMYETVVTGTPPDDDGLSRSRIDADDMRSHGDATVASALEREPSAHAGTGRRGERIITVRGFDQRGLAITLDGVPLAIPYDGQLDLGKLPTALIDHVTVVKGPASILHGPGGLGGTVDIETRDPSRGPILDATVEGGENGALRVDAYHSASRDGAAYGLGAGVLRRDGFPLSSSFEPTATEDGRLRENSDRSMRYAGGKLTLDLTPENRITAAPFVVDGEFGIPPSTVDSYPRYWRFNVWRAAVGQVSHAYEGKAFEIEEAVYAGVFDNRLDSFDDATYSSMDSPRGFLSWYHDRTVGGRVKAEVPAELLPWGRTYLRLWLGAEHDIHGSQLDLGERAKSYDRTVLTVVPEIEEPLPRGLTALVSSQVDVEFVSASDLQPATQQPEAGPLASLRWDPSDAFMMRLTGARRYRIPTLRERYSSAMGANEPNPDLRPETAWHAGLDVSIRPARSVSVDLSGFDAEITDMIEQVAIGGGLEQQENVGRGRRAGAEAALVLTWDELLEARLGYAFLHARRLDARPPDDQVEYAPAHQALFEIVATPIPVFEIGTSLRVVGPQAFQDRQILSWGELGAYAVWDARMAVRPTESTTAWVRGTNLLDANYQTEYGFPDPGRELWMGFGVVLDKVP
ncbi:MAG: TonB-dependent receptor [Deltaproteobacteria bacterium]|nr:TonB-dependent receptor [Deltaproteobacteria bacterium]